MATTIFDDITQHKPYPIKALKVWYDATNIYQFENLMSESNLSAEPIMRADGDGSMRTVAYKLTAKIYINRTDLIAFYESFVSTKKDVQILLGGYDNIMGSGIGWLTMGSAGISVALESAGKFLKVALTITCVTGNIGQFLNAN